MDIAQNHLELLCRWVRYDNFFDLGDVLRKNGISKVAIYGGAALGVLLYEKLKKSNIEVKLVVDKNKNLQFPYDVEVVTPDTMNDHLWKERDIDAVLVTAYRSFPTLFSVLKKQNIKCISIEELFIDIEEYFLFDQVCSYLNSIGVELILANVYAPNFHENPSDYELHIRTLPNGYRSYYDEPEWLKCCYYEEFTNYSTADIMKIFRYNTENAPLIKKNGIYYFNDIQTDFFNIVNNCRITANQPSDFDHSIYFFGNCIAVGCFSDDEHTVESQLQNKLLLSPLEKLFRVCNCANWREGKEALRPILDRGFEKGDKVVVISKELRKYTYYFDCVKYYEIDSVFDRPHKYKDKEIFFDNYHMGHRGYDLISDKIYSSIDLDEEWKCVVSKIKPNNALVNREKLEELPPELKDYLNYLGSEKIKNISGTIGAIVMNCNPFTLGHRYLIEESLKFCDYLYIFVVEEDKSYFSFEDRFKLVELGVEDLERVKVLRSGRYIISSETFPEYFVKESRVTAIDVSEDLSIFAEHIAPILNITKRFVGEEPICRITQQYNQAMKDVLPLKGVDVIEIKRIQHAGEVISASRVRQLEKEERYSEIAEIVPQSTLKYLINGWK